MRKILRGERGAVNAVASGARAHRDDRVADALGLCANELLLAHHAHRHGVHERVPFVGIVEDDVPGDGRHAHAVPVVADSLHDAGEEPAHARMLDPRTAIVTWPVDVWFSGSRTYEAVLDFGPRAIQKITLDPLGRFPDRETAYNVWPL